ncbi:MAG: SRPBCC family protein [Anaerolineales bacterium]
MKTDATTIIARPVGSVFAYINDVSNDVHWRNGVDDSGLRSGESLGVGSIGYTRVGDMEVEWRVISYAAGERVDWEFLNGPFEGRGGYRLATVDGGTQFTLVGDVEPTGLYKLLGPLFAWMGQRRNQADIEKLREILESMSD